MKIKPLVPALFCCLLAAYGGSSALADQVITNGNFEALPLGVESATNTFPGWLEGSNGSTVTTNAVAISGNYSALIMKFTGGDLHQNLTNQVAWLSDWVFDADFACSSPGGGAARSFQLNLYHTATANISMRVIDLEPDGVGDVQLYNGTAFVTVMTNIVIFSATPTNLNVNHVRIVGHYYNTNTPNYDLTVVSATGQSNSIFNEKLWQVAAPPTNAVTSLIQIRFDTANLVAGTFEVVDNVSLTVSNLSSSPAFTSQPTPAASTIYQGYTGTLAISSQAIGTPPIFYQWQLNGTNITDATNTSIVLSNLTFASAGNYALIASNLYGSIASSNAVLSVVPPFNTAQMTNIWNLSPGDQVFLTTNNNERGIAYNAVTTNLLLCSHFAAPTNNIAVLNPADGSFKYFMNMSGVAADTAGSTLGVNMIGVADDGVVYGGSVTANAGSASTPYNLYQWTSDDSNTVPEDIFVGDPGYSTAAAGLRWGDNLAVRGAGTGTQILIAAGTGTNVAVFTTSDGIDFLPTIIPVSNVPSGFAKNGLAFSPGTNTFWAKNGGGNLYLVQFDLIAETAFAAQTFGSNTVSSSLRGIAASPDGKWLIGAATGIPENVQLYNVSNLTNGPVLADQELFGTDFINNNIAGGVGSAAFNGNYVYVLDQNNGIKAFLIDPNYSASSNTTFSITGISSSPGVGTILTWQSTAGKMYQVQSKTDLAGSTWTNVGSAIAATGASTSATNVASGTQFFRIQQQ